MRSLLLCALLLAPVALLLVPGAAAWESCPSGGRAIGSCRCDGGPVEAGTYDRRSAPDDPWGVHPINQDGYEAGIYQPCYGATNQSGWHGVAARYEQTGLWVAIGSPFLSLQCIPIVNPSC